MKSPCFWNSRKIWIRLSIFSQFPFAFAVLYQLTTWWMCEYFSSMLLAHNLFSQQYSIFMYIFYIILLKLWVYLCPPSSVYAVLDVKLLPFFNNTSWEHYSDHEYYYIIYLFCLLFTKWKPLTRLLVFWQVLPSQFYN